jgi:hypothetical protein
VPRPSEDQRLSVGGAALDLDALAWALVRLLLASWQQRDSRTVSTSNDGSLAAKQENAALPDLAGGKREVKHDSRSQELS